MSRRLIVLFFLAAVAASPMIWFSVDPNAGEKLLALTQPSRAPTIAVKAGTTVNPPSQTR